MTIVVLLSLLTIGTSFRGYENVSSTLVSMAVVQIPPRSKNAINSSFKPCVQWLVYQFYVESISSQRFEFQRDKCPSSCLCSE